MKKSEFNSILSWKIPWKIYALMQLVLWKKYFLVWKRGKFIGLVNREWLSERNVSSNALSASGRKPWISGFARLRNSSKYLEKVVEAHLAFLDEVVLVDNNSEDETWDICQNLQKKYPDKVRIFRYLPEVWKLGSPEYQKWSENSVHDMSYYYNWTLAQTSYQYAMKIDDDHLPIPEVFWQIRSDILDGKYQKTFLALGLYNIEKSKDWLVVDLAHPIAGLYWDFGIFPVSAETYFVRDVRCENFIHGLRKKRGGIWLFHLKYRESGFWNRNYEWEIKSQFSEKTQKLFRMDEKWNQIFKFFGINED